MMSFIEGKMVTNKGNEKEEDEQKAKTKQRLQEIEEHRT